jgi:hypothetical protein
MPASLALVASGTPRAERRAVTRSRARGRLELVPRPVTLWCVACFVCGALGPVATSPDRGARPPKNSGFTHRTIGQVAGWICGDCDWKYRTMLPPATRGDCIDGPRPCRALLCKYNMWFDASRKADKSFVVLATCALDVADQGEHTLKAIGALWGMTREGVRYQQAIATDKLRAIRGLEIDFDEVLPLTDADDDDEEEGDGSP